MLSLPVSITQTAGGGDDPRLATVGPNGEKLRQTYLIDGTDTEVSRDDTKRQFGDRLITQEEIAAINKQCQITDLDILEIAPRDSVDERRVTKHYYVYPHAKNGNPKAFNMFYEALVKVNGCAVVKWTPSSRQELLAIYPDGDGCLIAAGLAFAGDFKEPDSDVNGHGETEASEAEVEMATKLLTAVMGDGSTLDTAADDAVALKKDLLNGAVVEIAPQEEVAPAGDDLVGALQASLDALKVAS